MRLTTKLSILALVFATAIAFQPVASATTLDLVYNGTVAGTVTLTQNGSSVDVSISMKSGFAILGNGGDIGVAGSVSNKTTINDFSVTGMSADLKMNGKGKPLTTLGGFSFDDIFKLSMGHGNGQTFSTTLNFTINNASSISALGLHICIKFADGTCANNSTVFVETSQPPTVPEPSTLGLLGTGLVGLAGVVRRRLFS